jgi:hypothetical protein
MVTTRSSFKNTATSTKSANTKNAPNETFERRITRSCSQNQQIQIQQTDSKPAVNLVTATSAISTQIQTTKISKNERRRNEALLELQTLGNVASLIVSGQRRRKQAEHQDAAFVMASIKQSKDAGRKGGLIAGSRHHYDRSYRS